MAQIQTFLEYIKNTDKYTFIVDGKFQVLNLGKGEHKVPAEFTSNDGVVTFKFEVGLPDAEHFGKKNSQSAQAYSQNDGLGVYVQVTDKAGKEFSYLTKVDPVMMKKLKSARQGGTKVTA